MRKLEGRDTHAENNVQAHGARSLRQPRGCRNHPGGSATTPGSEGGCDHDRRRCQHGRGRGSRRGEDHHRLLPRPHRNLAGTPRSAPAEEVILLDIASDIVEKGYDTLTEPLHRRRPLAGDLVEFILCIGTLLVFGAAATLFTQEGRAWAKRITTFN